MPFLGEALDLNEDISDLRGLIPANDDSQMSSQDKSIGGL